MVNTPRQIDVTIKHVDMLTRMFEMQRALQTRINGYDLDTQTLQQRIDNFKENILACTDELHEALNETGWKSWATSKHFHTDRVCKELVDAWCFLLNNFLHAGMTAEDLFTEYVLKTAINNKRQDDGYTGLNKCPHCKRAYDDSFVDCRAPDPGQSGSSEPAYCDEIRQHVSPSGDVLTWDIDAGWYVEQT